MFKKNDIVYGMNPVLEAIEAGREIEKIFPIRELPTLQFTNNAY